MFSSQSSSSPANPTSNPFAQPTQNPFGAPKNIFSQGSSGWQPPKENPFLKKPNPFEAAKPDPPTAPFGPQSKKPLNNPFAPNGTNPKSAPQPSADLKPSATSTPGTARPNPFSNGPSSATAPSPAQDWGYHKQEFVQPAWPASNDTYPSISSTPKSDGKPVNGVRMRNGGPEGKAMLSKSSPGPRSAANSTTTAVEPKRDEKSSRNRRSQEPHKGRVSGRGSELAMKIRNQLAKDGIKPPKWPSNPGSLSQRKTVEKFREAYSAYREKAMRSLIQAGLFDDPDKKRRLSEAINFRGICEDMCPDWDKVTRIVQHDVKKEEKEEVDGELVASLPLMVTRYSRSSAGQDLPLPMDVRSPGALHRTLDYLISELIPSDDLLPVRHHFLWDRTRAIRREFTFQGAAMSREEKKDYLYCLETITRFHVTSLHLLSKPDFGHEGFSEQQEIEQLSKTLISLMEAYDDCAKEGIVCENEFEFRGYYIVFNAGDPGLMQKVRSWGDEFSQSDGVRTAICLIQSLQNTWTETGPLVPRAKTEMALSMAAMFFSIVASPQISYTMACFAEVHFGSARYAMLQTILNGYQRPEGSTKDITAAFLKERLHFDTEEEAINFCQLHRFRFRNIGGKMLMLIPPPERQTKVPKVRVPHSYSHDIVERKRGTRPLPEVIYNTVWEGRHNETNGEHHPADSSEDSLFVNGAEDATTFDQDDKSEAGSDVEYLGTTALPATRREAGKSASTTSTLSPSSIFVPLNGQNGPLTAPSMATQGVQSRDFASQMNGSAGSSSSLFQKPSGSIFSQGTDVKKPHASTTAFSTPTAKQTNLQPNTTSSTTSSALSFSDNIGNKNNVSTTPSPNKSNLFTQLPSASSINKDAPSAPVFPSSASAPSTGTTFPTSSGFPSSVPKSVPAAKLPSSLGNAFPKPKESTPSTGVLLTPTSQESIVSQKPSPFPPATNSIFPPLAKPSQPPSEQSQSLGSLQPAPVGKDTQLSQVSRPDPMDRFTRWYVSGDRGLMETRLERFVVENLLRDVWDEYWRAEEERKRREEDERSWAEARKYREYSLSVKYFYIWRDGSRRRRAVKRIQAETEKARQWRLPGTVAKREAAARAARNKVVEEAKDLIEKKARENAEQLSRLSQSTQSRRESREQTVDATRRRPREESIENALLASGVLDGVRDPQEAARYAARDAKTDSDEGMLPGEQMLLRVKNQRRRKQGLQPLKQIPEPKTYKEGSKSAKLKALASGSGRDTLSMSTGSFRNSTFSSSYRSSLGFNSSRIAKTRSKVTDPYWHLKAKGLVQMPNGEYLHESLALPMLQEGKRFPGLGDFGLPKEQSISPSQSPPSKAAEPTHYSPSNGLRRGRISSSPSFSNIFAKRKRNPIEDELDEDLAMMNGSTVFGDRKRARSGARHDANSDANEPDLLANIDDLIKQVQEVNRASSQA